MTAAGAHHPGARIELGPPEGGWFRESLARIRLPLITAFWRRRTWWLLHRSAVHVGRWHNPVLTIILVSAAWLLTVILVAWGIHGFLVVFFFRENGLQLGPFNPDQACGGKNAGTACGAINGVLMPIFLLASSTVVFLGWRQWRVRRFYTRAARREPARLVQTAGSLMGEVVGRDHLSDALMNNLRDRKARRPHVIVGGVGVGKTAVLVYLTERLAAKGAVPVPIRLRDVQAEEQLDFGELARKRFAEIVQPVVRSDAEEDRLWRWLRQRSERIVVLADGLEEALGGPELAAERDNIIRRAIRAAHEEALPLVIAARPHDPLRAMQAAITELEPLSEEAALDYIARSGTWRSDPVLLDRVVEAAKMAEAPLYLQIARDLHGKDLLEPLWAEAVSNEPALQDRWAFREDLLSAWLDALVEGKLRAELPIDQPTREAVVTFISALACIGLARDSATVALGDLDPSLATHDAGQGWKAHWDYRVGRCFGNFMKELREPLSDSDGARPGPGSQSAARTVAITAAGQAPAASPPGVNSTGQGDLWMDARVAATWGTRMGLVQEAEGIPRAPRQGEQDPGGTPGAGGRVHFQHSVMQAYLGSRILPGVLEPDETTPRDCAGDNGEVIRCALLNSGRELRIALILHSRSLDGRCTCRDGSPPPRCRVGTMRKQMEDAALKLLREAEARSQRRCRADGEMPSRRFEPGRRGSLRRSALEILGTAVEISSVDADPQLDELFTTMSDHWPEFGLGEDLVRLRETKLAAVEQCTVAARRAVADKEQQAAYSRLLDIACKEPDHRVRVAIARQIGIGGERAYHALPDDLKEPEYIRCGNGKDQSPQPQGSNSPQDARNDLPQDARLSNRECRAWQRRWQKRHARYELGCVRHEMEGENKRWYKTVMGAWLLPMLVESADMSGHKGSPWRDLERFISTLMGKAAGVSAPSLDAGSADEAPLYGGIHCAESLVLAQGFKFAANRRLTPWSNQKAREFLTKKAEELLNNSTFWYTRLTLLQALTLWELPDDVNAPQYTRGHGADPKGKVEEWLRMDTPHEEHPLVKEAADLAVRALQTRRPERFLWIDEANVVSQIGTEAGAPGEPRLHNLWIPPSVGWSSLDFKAQQLLADVLLLLVLGERDSRPRELFSLEGRLSREQELPSCLSRDRTRLDPVQAVESGAQPGDNCRDDCKLKMCPYPVKTNNLRVEFNELFCLRQRSMLDKWRPKAWLYLHFRREAPWQHRVPVTGMRRFWDEMGERARDSVRPRREAAEPPKRK